MFGFISRFVGDVCRCINQCHTGRWRVAARWSPPRIHPTSRRSGSVLVELDLVEDFFCCAHCQRMLRLQSLRIPFPLLSISLDFCNFYPGVVVFFFFFNCLSSL